METLAKLLSVVLFGMIANDSFAQGALSLTEMNVLYRNYDNIIELGTGQLKKEVIPVSPNLSITPLNDSSVYIARVNGSGREATIYVVSKDLKDTLSKVKYRIRNLPIPVLYLGTITDGGSVDLNNLQLAADWGRVTGPSTAEFSILNYEIKWEGLEHRITGIGDKISEETLNELKALQLSLAPDQSISIHVEAKTGGPDGNTQIISSTFYLR